MASPHPSLPAAVMFCVGVDGGGTGTRARVQDLRGRTLGTGHAGPSGLSLGVEQAWSHVQQAIAEAFAASGEQQPPPSRLALGLGLAGATVRSLRAGFLQRNPGYAVCELASDGVTQLLGAHAGGPGVVVAAGTGSVAALRDLGGQVRECGGWGFPAGDEGGGAWLGLRAVRHLQRVLDGREPGAALARAVGLITGSDAASLLAWCARADQTDYAGLAPRVFEAAAEGDDTARDLLRRAAHALERLVLALDDVAGVALPVAICGSVGERLVAHWPAVLHDRLLPPLGDSCDGALRLLRGAGRAAVAPLGDERPGGAA